MPNAPFYNGNTNPNAKGGAFGYDGRTGLGIGSLTKGPASGIGSNWSMGDALSSPKSEFDYEEKEEVKKFIVNSDTTVRDLALFAGLIEDSDDDFNELEAGIESKAHSSFHRGAVDSLSHRGKDISSLGGLGNSMAGVIGLSAGYVPDGNVMIEQDLKEYIRQVFINEFTMSGRLASMSRPKAKNTGGKRNSDPMSIDTSSASTNTADAAPVGKLPVSRSSNHKGYTNSTKTPDIFPYSKSGKATNDGGETMSIKRSIVKHEIEEEDFDSGKSTFDILNDESSEENIDNLNFMYLSFIK